MPKVPRALVLAVLALAVAGCGGSNGGENATKTPRPGPGAPVVDLSQLPLGDGRLSTLPEVGAVYACAEIPPAPEPLERDWISGEGTWDATTKPVILDDETSTLLPDSRVVLAGEIRRVITNTIPAHPFGAFPVDPMDPAYVFEANPNTIVARDLQLELPRTPTALLEPNCVGRGPVGILLSGSLLYAPLDDDARDAVAYPLFDYCDGHVHENGIYHYHSVTRCAEDEWEGGHSRLVGYALDGFGIYGHYDEAGTVMTNDDLDPCHGHTHEIEWDGEMRVMYHYHATWEYPYVVGCFRGDPIEIDPSLLD